MRRELAAPKAEQRAAVRREADRTILGTEAGNELGLPSFEGKQIVDLIPGLRHDAPAVRRDGERSDGDSLGRDRRRFLAVEALNVETHHAVGLVGGEQRALAVRHPACPVDVEPVRGQRPGLSRLHGQQHELLASVGNLIGGRIGGRVEIPRGIQTQRQRPAPVRGDSARRTIAEPHRGRAVRLAQVNALARPRPLARLVEEQQPAVRRQVPDERPVQM